MSEIVGSMCKPYWKWDVSDEALTNNELQIIECLVFIKATAAAQRREGGRRGRKGRVRAEHAGVMGAGDR